MKTAETGVGKEWPSLIEMDRIFYESFEEHFKNHFSGSGRKLRGGRA
jgi:hypothetical protein